MPDANPPMTDVAAAPHLGHSDLCALIPHRFPFLLLDQVIAIEAGQRGTAVKNVTANDTQLVGHFPDEPIMPGVLIVEACAQLAALVMASDKAARRAGGPHPATGTEPAGREAIGYLASINRFKFMRSARPGDRLVLNVRIGKRFQNLCHVPVVVSCERNAVATGEIAVSLPS